MTGKNEHLREPPQCHPLPQRTKALYDLCVGALPPGNIVKFRTYAWGVTTSSNSWYIPKIHQCLILNCLQSDQLSIHHDSSWNFLDSKWATEQCSILLLASKLQTSRYLHYLPGNHNPDNPCFWFTKQSSTPKIRIAQISIFTSLKGLGHFFQYPIHDLQGIVADLNMVGRCQLMRPRSFKELYKE